MVVLGYLLIGIGVILALIGGIGLLIAAFKESVIWGLGCLLVPLVGLIFVVTHWAESKNSFFCQVGGFGCLMLGGMCLPPH